MAVDAPLLTRQRVFGAAVETTTGTLPTINAAAAVYNAYNVAYRTDISRNRREGQSSLSQLPQVHGQRAAEITLETELVGNGSAGQPQWASVLLTAAGFTASGGTYTPSTGSASYTTIGAGVFQDGRFKSIAGACGDLVMRGRAGEVVRNFWRLRGVHQAPSSVALITPTYPTTIPPRLAAATFTIGGTAYKLATFELALNNVLAPREDAASAAGIHSFVVGDNDFTFRCSLESQLFSVQDFYSSHLAGTEAALSLVIGSVANNIITITAPKMQLAEAPQDEDANGVLRDNLLFQLNRSAAAGDDQLSIALT